MESLTVTVKQAAELLGVSEDTIRQMEADGALKRLKKLRGVRFNRKTILDVAEEQENGIRWRDYTALKAENQRLKEENEALKSLFRQRLSMALTDFDRIERTDERRKLIHTE